MTKGDQAFFFSILWLRLTVYCYAFKLLHKRLLLSRGRDPRGQTKRNRALKYLKFQLLMNRPVNMKILDDVGFIHNSICRNWSHG